MKLDLLDESSTCLIPSLFSIAGKSIQRWAMSDDIRDIPGYTPNTNIIISNLIKNCYDQALDEFTIFMFRNANLENFDSALNYKKLFNCFNELKKILKTSLKIQHSINPANQEKSFGFTKELLWFSQGFMALMKNCLIHGDWTKEIIIIIETNQISDRYQYKISIANYRQPKNFQIDYTSQEHFLSNCNFCVLEPKGNISAFLDFMHSGFQSTSTFESKSRTKTTTQYYFNKLGGSTDVE